MSLEGPIIPEIWRFERMRKLYVNKREMEEERDGGREKDRLRDIDHKKKDDVIRRRKM